MKAAKFGHKATISLSFGSIEGGVFFIRTSRNLMVTTSGLVLADTWSHDRLT
jgi:hypothetical protein